MKVKSLVIIFAAVAIGAQCRSLVPVKTGDADRSARVHRDANQDASPSSRTETSVSRNSLNLTGEKTSTNTPEQLKELIASYEENFAKLVNFVVKVSKNKDNNKREIQFLNQLSSLIEQLIQEQSKVNGMYAKFGNDTDSILQTPNSKLTMSVNNVNDLIDTIKEIDIVYQDGEITDEHIRIKRAVEGYRGAASFATSEERMTNMLIDILRQLVQIRKCLDKLCKKHHSTTEANSNDDNSPQSAEQNIDYLKW